MKQSIGSDSVETFNRDMSEKNLGGHWQLGLESYLPYPETTVQPCLWKWKDVYESLMRAGEIVAEDHQILSLYDNYRTFRFFQQ